MSKGKTFCGKGYNSKHGNGKESRLEIGANDLHPFRAIKNKHGKYIPYCAFSGHQGVIGVAKVKTCERKRCIYLRYYLEGFPPYLDEKKLNA